MVDLRGYPGRLRWKEKTIVGTTIRDVYNDLVDCGTGDFYRQITSVTMKPVTFDDEGEATFSLVYRIKGTCQGCTVASSGTARLFTYMDGTFSDRCPCIGPSILDFRNQSSTRIDLVIRDKLTSGNIVGLEEVSELEDIPSCGAFQTLTSSSVAIQYLGCPSKVQESEFYALGEKFVQVYNRMNGMNAILCDPFFREIVSAVPVLDGGNVPSTRDRGREMLKSPEYMTTTTTSAAAAAANGSTRALQAADDDATCDEYFVVRYEITARCRNCDLDKITLFDKPDAVNYLEGDYSDDSVRSLYTAEYGAAPTDWDSSIGHQEDEEKHERRFLSESSKCQCPIDASFRAVTEDEMTAAFGVSMIDFISLKVEFIVEVGPVPCNPDVETFETTVEVEFEFESEDGSIPQEDADSIAAAFLLSYNSLQARNCDPYFRELASAEIVDQAVTRCQAILYH